MNLLKSKWFTLVIIAILGWLSLAFVKIKIQSDLINKEAAIIEEKIAGLERDNESIEKHLALLEHPSFLEREARLKLNYKADGENVVFVYPDANQISSGSEDFYIQFYKQPNYLKWIYYILGY